MGDLGGLVYGLNASKIFSAVACLSAAPFDIENLDSVRDDRKTSRMRGVMENAGRMELYFTSRDNLSRLCKGLAGNPKLLKFYFACGKDDFLYTNFKKFRTFTEEVSFDATFEEYDGYTHEWRFWDMTIQRAIVFFDLKGKGGKTF
jgi:putative tributyrin esterase